MRHFQAVVTVLIAALLGASLAILWSGGGRFAIGRLEISARSWARPLTAAALLALIFRITWLATGRASVSTTAVWLSRTTMAALVVAGLAVSAASIIYACGGLDSHGYVASSRLFSEGAVRRDIAHLSWLPLPDPAEAAAPLGFIPAPDDRSIVPEFPPGFPLVMAATRALFGADAVFVVPWFAAVVLAAAIYAIARVRYGELTAALAAVITIAHPLVVAYSIQAMSDVPAAMWTAIAVWSMTAPRQRPLVGGIAAAAAFLTRPPLALPMAVLAAASLRRAPRAGVTFGAGLAAGVVALMLLQQLLYGNPFVSGHGGASRLFILSTLPHNLVAHGKWFLVLHTPLVLALLWAGYRTDRQFSRLMFAIAGAVALPYFFYSVPFDDWEMQRFLLPGIVLVLPIAAEGIVAPARRIPFEGGAHLAVAAVAVVVMAASGAWLTSRGVFRLEAQESKYPRVGAWLREHTPDNAIVLASLHSGSANYYSGRQTLRWDRIPPDRLAATIDAAAQRGMPSYLVLDGNPELSQFERIRINAGSRLRVEPLERILTVQVARIDTAPEAAP